MNQAPDIDLSYPIANNSEQTEEGEVDVNHKYLQPQKIFHAERQTQSSMSFPPTQSMYSRENDCYYQTQQQNLQSLQQTMNHYQMYPPPPPTYFPGYLQHPEGIHNKEGNYYEYESQILNIGLLNARNREIQDRNFEHYLHNSKRIQPNGSENIQNHSIPNFPENEEIFSHHSQNYISCEEPMKISNYSIPSNYSCNSRSTRLSIGTQDASPFFSRPISMSHCSISSLNKFDLSFQDHQPPTCSLGSGVFRMKCECTPQFVCSHHAQPYFQNLTNTIKIENDDPTKLFLIRENQVSQPIVSNQNPQIKYEMNDIQVSSFEQFDSKGQTVADQIEKNVIKDEKESLSDESSSDQAEEGDQFKVKEEEPKINNKMGVNQKGGNNSNVSQTKPIKKYKPKKKYKQSKQKNVFKNFGNALMNCIENNFVIRDFIEKKLGNEALIDNFHIKFLKNLLNHLKNKDDFLQGWKVNSADEGDEEQALFKSVFKEVSLRFFNEYAEKYVNESDKLKNKDIHIKAIPIFIKGINNVVELQKFKLS